MRRFSRVFKYLGFYKLEIARYFITIILSIVFSILSLGMLLPFLQLIFGVQGGMIQAGKATSNPLLNWVNEQLNALMSRGDAIYALSTVCILIIITIFLKNLFLELD